MRAFATACGASPGEWADQLRQAADTVEQAPPASTGPAQAAPPPSRRDVKKPAAAGAAATLLLSAGFALGAVTHPGGRGTSASKKTPAVAAIGRAADGADPVAAGCVKDAELADKAPVMLGGQQIGALELRYSPRCMAGWARIYLYPGEPAMLGQVTVRASDGRLATFANPLDRQVPVYTNVITAGPGGCLAATAVFRPPAHTPVTAAIPCQDPA